MHAMPRIRKVDTPTVLNKVMAAVVTTVAITMGACNMVTLFLPACLFHLSICPASNRDASSRRHKLSSASLFTIERPLTSTFSFMLFGTKSLNKRVSYVVNTIIVMHSLNSHFCGIPFTFFFFFRVHSLFHSCKCLICIKISVDREGFRSSSFDSLGCINSYATS